MKRLLFKGMMGLSLLPMLAMGCSHNKRCCMMCMSPCSGSRVANAVNTRTSDTDVKNVGHKEEENGDAVLVNAVAPSMSPYGGDVCGVVRLSAKEAKQLGIRPGYTPSALALSPKADTNVQQCGASEKKEPVSYLPE